MENSKTEKTSANTQVKNDNTTSTKSINNSQNSTCCFQEILETRVRPAVQEDGGDIVYKDFKVRRKYLSLNNSPYKHSAASH